MAGAGGSRSATPRVASASSADSKVIWLDITDPARISSAVRSLTSVTSWPCRTSPSANAVPAGPAPTIAIRRGELMPPSVSPVAGLTARDGVEDRRPRRRQRVDDREVVDARELAVVQPVEPRPQTAAALHRHRLVRVPVHDHHLALGTPLHAGGRVRRVVPLRQPFRSASEKLHRGAAAHA